MFVISYKLTIKSGNSNSNACDVCLLYSLGDGRMDSPGKFCSINCLFSIRINNVHMLTDVFILQVTVHSTVHIPP